MLRSLLVVFLSGWVAHAAAPPADVLARGKVEYEKCITCHGPDGKGMKVESLVLAPSLHESEIVKGDPAALALVVLKGIKKEDPKYVQQMVAQQEVFKDAQLAEMMTFVRHTWGGVDGVVTEKDAKQFRKMFRQVKPGVSRQAVAGHLIQARGASALVSNLSWKAYEGAWNKLPDFDKLKPYKEGMAKNALIDIAVAEKNERFGMVFTGTLTLPADDTCEFTTASDDGSDLWIDGKRIVDNDGTHGVQARSGKAKLKAGPHELVVRFFEHGGGEDLMVNVKAKSLAGTVTLSKKPVSGGGGGGGGRSIPLEPENEGEAVMYRNFIAGSNPRGIAVGYPGGFNLCWDADTMNVAMLWRGDFMDAGRHWSGRGGGSQPPAGQAVIKPAPGFPMRVVDSDSVEWNAEAHKVPFKFGKDSAERTQDKTFIGRHPDYRFGGYKLDGKRFPRFKYTFQGIPVSEFFAPDGDALMRTITFGSTSRANEKLMFRVASGADPIPGGLALDGMIIAVEGAEVALRGEEALVPVKGVAELRLTYRWTDYEANLP